MSRIIHCTGCHAEISDDRKACPHCSTAVVSEQSRRDALMADNLRLSMELAAAEGDLAKENAALSARLAALKSSKKAPVEDGKSA
jgi:hypothetical protein